MVAPQGLPWDINGFMLTVKDRCEKNNHCCRQSGCPLKIFLVSWFELGKPTNGLTYSLQRKVGHFESYVNYSQRTT